MLDAEHRLSGQLQPRVGAVEQADVGFPHRLGQRGAVDGEAVVHRDDLDLAGGQVLHRMVRAVVALVHLHRLRPEGEGQHLVTQADAEHRHAAVDQLADLRDRVLTRRGRVARSVGQQHPVRLAGQDVLGLGIGRNHGGAGADRGQGAQDVALDAVVDDHDLVLRGLELAVALVPLPQLLVPDEALAGGGVLCEVQTDQARPAFGFGDKSLEVELAGRAVGDDGVRHALLADHPGQGAGVDPGQADDAAALHPGVQRAVGAVVGRIGRGVAEDRAARGGLRPAADLLQILGVGSDIADVGEGEGDDLRHVGRVGQDLLIPGHGGVEAHLADRLADRPDPDALQHRAVGERENARGARVNLARH